MRALTLFALLLAGCSQSPAIVTNARKAELLRTLQRELDRSVQAEKSAVLAITDEDSERFAAQSREAAAAVEKARGELRPLMDEQEAPLLDVFDTAWARVAEIDARLLPLATANTNLKAARLSQRDAAEALDRVLDVFHAAQAETTDPKELRTISDASVAALRIQALHAPHIASPDDAEMSALEARVQALEQQVQLAFTPRKQPSKTAALLSKAQDAWSAYVKLTETILELSRTNSNVLSFSLSIHEKREATEACEAALLALTRQAHRGPQPTR